MGVAAKQAAPPTGTTILWYYSIKRLWKPRSLSKMGLPGDWHATLTRKPATHARNLTTLTRKTVTFTQKLIMYVNFGVSHYLGT